VAAAERVLLERGALEVDQLTEALLTGESELIEDRATIEPEAGAAEEVLAALRRSDAFWGLSDGRLAPVLHHLRRATFTHRLSRTELEREAIDLVPDLVALALPSSCTLGDGTQLVVTDVGRDSRATDHGSLLGPTGWLAAYSPGDLIAVGYDGHAVRLESVAEIGLGDAAEHAVRVDLRSTFAALDSKRTPEAHQLVVETTGRHPTSFATGVAPVAELLAASGLRVRGAWVGPVDSPWMTPLEQARERRLAELIPEADDESRSSARRALAAWHAWMRAIDDGEDTVRDTDPDGRARLLSDIDRGPVPAVLGVVARHGRPTVSVRRLGAWAESLADGADFPTAGVSYLRALGADAAGDIAGAEAHLNAALKVRSEDRASLVMLAELAMDRGDAQLTLDLFRRAGHRPEAELLAELEPFLVGKSVKRNDPCPCGSGRKFKACCARRPFRAPLVDRCRWLLTKAARHTARSDPAMAESLTQFLDPSIAGDATDDLIRDCLLFSSKGLARYLDARGDLVPDDELAWARMWIGQPMTVLEVRDRGPDGAVEAVDVRSGEPLVFIGEPPMVSAEDELVIARALPIQDQWLWAGVAVAVPSSSREKALTLSEQEIGPLQLIELLVDQQMASLT